MKMMSKQQFKELAGVMLFLAVTVGATVGYVIFYWTMNPAPDWLIESQTDRILIDCGDQISQWQPVPKCEWGSK